MARPLKKVDTEAIKKLAQLHCTYDEIAEFSGVSTKTLQRHYVHLIKKGRQTGKISLRRAQFEKALGGNVVMQIWLGKQHLDQRDKIFAIETNISLQWIKNNGTIFFTNQFFKSNFYNNTWRIK